MQTSSLTPSSPIFETVPHSVSQALEKIPNRQEGVVYPIELKSEEKDIQEERIIGRKRVYQENRISKSMARYRNSANSPNSSLDSEENETEVTEVNLIRRLARGDPYTVSLNGNGKNLVHHAAELGYTAFLRIVFRSQPHLANTQDLHQVTPLHYATLHGYEDTIRLLHSFGADLNAKDRTGSVPAEWACLGGKTQALRTLHELGADMDARDDLSETLGHLAAKFNHIETLNFLIEVKREMFFETTEIGYVPMHLAAIRGHEASIRLFHQKGFPLNPKDNLGATPAHYASRDSHLNILRFLNHVDPRLLEEKDNLHWTIAHFATIEGRVKPLQFIYKKFPHLLPLVDASGWTIAHYAVEKRHMGVLIFLKDIHSPLLEKHSIELIEIATRNGNRDILQFLTEYYKERVQTIDI